ncbi:hypothetical protein MUK42_15886 [Musa troglodytarum]|uniref:Uncharacterized protein n=1 Tax=Musa troglodytarum TaxID=320322 RepID=A0A9E7HHN0_9LILI|nr:hypothetical protein MUK42_15886 [Musa troglodytarum]
MAFVRRRRYVLSVVPRNIKRRGSKFPFPGPQQSPCREMTFGILRRFTCETNGGLVACRRVGSQHHGDGDDDKESTSARWMEESVLLFCDGRTGGAHVDHTTRQSKDRYRLGCFTCGYKKGIQAASSRLLRRPFVPAAAVEQRRGRLRCHSNVCLCSKMTRADGVVAESRESKFWYLRAAVTGAQTPPLDAIFDAALPSHPLL